MQSSVILGNTVSVEVNVTGTPPPDITLTFNQEDACKAGLATLEADGEKQKMTIENASLEHHGTYTIEAVNEAGKDRKDIQLSVIGW